MATRKITIQYEFTDGSRKDTGTGDRSATWTQTNAGVGNPTGSATTSATALASIGTVNVSNEYTLVLTNRSTTVPILLYDDSGATSPRGKVPVAPSSSQGSTICMVVEGGTTIYTKTASGTAAYDGHIHNN